jgi:hypothetical protein
MALPATEPKRNYDGEVANELIAELGPGKARKIIKMIRRTGWKRLNWDRIDEYVARPAQTNGGGLFDEDGGQDMIADEAVGESPQLTGNTQAQSSHQSLK